MCIWLFSGGAFIVAGWARKWTTNPIYRAIYETKNVKRKEIETFNFIHGTIYVVTILGLPYFMLYGTVTVWEVIKESHKSLMSNNIPVPIVQVQ